MKKFLLIAVEAVALTALTSAVNVIVSKKVAEYMDKNNPLPTTPPVKKPAKKIIKK